MKLSIFVNLCITLGLGVCVIVLTAKLRHANEELRALRIAADRYYKGVQTTEDLLTENQFMSAELAYLHCKVDMLANLSRLGGWQSRSVLDGLRHCNQLRSKKES